VSGGFRFAEEDSTMLHRMLPLFVAALALLLFLGGAALADDKKADDKDNTHTGVVVKAGDNKLTMTDKDGKNEHTHDVDKDAKITCDGKECKLDDLKKGFTVTVTTEKKADKTVATKIEAKKKS